MIIPDFSPEQTAVWEAFPDAGVEAASQNINPAVMREGVVVQMTWPGAPTVYYGDEAGVCGFTCIRITEELIHGDMRIR